MSQGVLLMNLGSPDSPGEDDVRTYLREFLMDPRVMDTPFPIRYCVVNFAILPKRPKESGHAYSTVWTSEGSPLIVISKHQQAELQRRMNGVPVELAMRYRKPSVQTALENLKQRGVTDVAFIPLFPHYAMSSYETAVEHVLATARKHAPGMKFQIQKAYYNEPAFIRAWVDVARDSLAKPYDHVLFSFHGLPERHLRKSDPTGSHCLKTPDCCERPNPAHEFCYRAQCYATVRAFTQQAGIPQDKYSVSFQSRLGRDPWLQPYTDVELERLPQKQGVRKLVVMCPAFVSDCLETLEEMGARGRDTFLQAGGSEYTLVPCLNEHPSWIDALEKYARQLLAAAPASPSPS